MIFIPVGIVVRVWYYTTAFADLTKTVSTILAASATRTLGSAATMGARLRLTCIADAHQTHLLSKYGGDAQIYN